MASPKTPAQKGENSTCNSIVLVSVWEMQICGVRCDLVLASIFFASPAWNGSPGAPQSMIWRQGDYAECKVLVTTKGAAAIITIIITIVVIIIWLIYMSKIYLHGYNMWQVLGMNQGFIVSDLVTDKVQTCDTMMVASPFASNITRSGDLVEENNKREGKMKHLGTRKHENVFVDFLFVLKICQNMASKVRKTCSL